MPKKTKIVKPKNISKLSDSYKWYFYRFRLKYNFGKAPKWWLDLFIIDRIFRIIIKDKGINYQVKLWRFHRRSGEDNTGHQTTLACYTTGRDSVTIDNIIRSTPSFKLLSDGNLLREYFIEEGGEYIDGSGDGHWPIEIRQSWPYFIQGASESILEMLRLIIDGIWHMEDFDNILDIEEFYQKVNERLVHIWYSQGGHAYLHHLNALFGYEMTRVRQSILTSF